MTTEIRMTRIQAGRLLREFIEQWAIDPNDAGLIFAEIPAEGIDTETLGDYLDGQGYPELATVAYDWRP